MLVQMGGRSLVAVRDWSHLLHRVWPVSCWLMALQVGVSAWDGKDCLLGMAVGDADWYCDGLGAWSLASHWEGTVV